MAVLAAVMLQNLDEDDDNSSTSSRGSSSGGSGSGSTSGNSIGSGSSYDSGVAWTSTDTTTNGFNYGTPSSNHSGRRRRNPTTPHRIVCSSPVKNAFLKESERIDMLLQVSESSNCSGKSQRPFSALSTSPSNKMLGLTYGDQVVQSAKKTRRKMNNGSNSNQKFATTTKSTSAVAKTMTTALAFESQHNNLNYYFHISNVRKGGAEKGRNDELCHHRHHNHHHHHHHHNYTHHSPQHNQVYKYHYEIVKNDANNNNHSLNRSSKNRDQTTKNIIINNLFTAKSTYKFKPKPSPSPSPSRSTLEHKQLKVAEEQQQQPTTLDSVNNSVLSATPSLTLFNSSLKSNLAGEKTTTNACANATVKTSLYSSLTKNGGKINQPITHQSNSQTNGKHQTNRSKYVVKNQKGLIVANGNHEISEYFPVRRSVRKTKSAVKEEMARNLECAILEEKCDGLKVAYFEGKGRGVVAERRFERGEFVIEYMGDLISISEATEREKRYALDENAGCYMYYFKHQNQQYCIDATEDTGKLGRLVNHSRNGNLMTKVVVVKQVPHLVLIAKENIEVGDEISYDYGDRSKESLLHHPWLAF